MKILILGGGAFGTAIGSQLAYNSLNEIYLFQRSSSRHEELVNDHTNHAYFPNKKLNASLKSTIDYKTINDFTVIMIALPTKFIEAELEKIKPYIRKDALIVNLSKGILKKSKTIVELICDVLSTNNVITLKGASFASEMVDSAPTLLTLGYEYKEQYNIITNIIKKTNIYIDYTTDIRGVELLSALKNIYAIFLGYVDGQYNSANTRFMILTKCFAEIKIILKALGGREETLLLSAGFGDLGLTALNDLSRNRTLGLLIGKGFFNSDFTNHSVVLEGIKTLNMIDEAMPDLLKKRLPIFARMANFFNSPSENKMDIVFDELMENNYKTVLTYGTFDLFHYGHVEILRRAKSLGDRLVVGLSTDEFNLLKGKKCEFSFEKRKRMLESIEYVDLVIPENEWEQKVDDVTKNNVDIFVMGDDWRGKFDFLSEYCQVHYFERTEGISTTKLKSILKD
tara:strand:+ start:6579 stop:7940 length:1362 start_codon:yes stop_codon:yes gene_type:complete